MAVVPYAVARLAFRVVQESLTNALRYAPGAEARIAISAEDEGEPRVRVENDGAVGRPSSTLGSGRGLLGLRERVHALGGRLTAGATLEGGWAVETRLPAR